VLPRICARTQTPNVVCVCASVYTILGGAIACVYVRVNVFVHYSWVSEFHLSSHLFNKTTKKVPTCTWMHSSPPAPSPFMWFFLAICLFKRVMTCAFAPTLYVYNRI
jgi:hypothetical protein